MGVNRPTLIPWLAFAAILGAWGIFSSLPLDWSAWQPATCLPACFCEALHAGALAQPVNSWSSLAFALPGLLVISARPTTSALIRRTEARVTYGIALLVIGLGSAFYHASLSFAGQFFDVMGMYLLISFAALYALARLGWLAPGLLPAAYLAVNLLLAGVLLWLPGVRREVFGGLVVVTLALEAWSLRGSLRRGRYLLGAIVSLGAAFAIWSLDNSRTLCSPQSIFQGHAAWHVLGALAAWLLYQYYIDGPITSVERTSHG